MAFGHGHPLVFLIFIVERRSNSKKFNVQWVLGGGKWGWGGFFALTGDEYTRVKQGGVSHCGLAIYIKKYLKGKRRIMKTQIFFTMQKYNLKKRFLKKTPKSFKIL